MNPDSKVKTIAVIDLETNDLPSKQNNTCAITELCIYAFQAKHFSTIPTNVPKFKPDEVMEGVGNLDKGPPNLPRVLHKLKIMINPDKPIHEMASQLSGLSNDMLINEASFDINTANCILSFLDRLEKPVCFVAHNGWKFDYPIIRYVFSQIAMEIPPSMYCIDSFAALRELDEKYHLIQQKILALSPMQPLDESAALDEYKLLFSDAFQPRERFPQRGTYVLGNIYNRLFEQPADENLHCAEADVSILTKIILSYGLSFLAYVECRKRPFGDVPTL